MWKERLWQVFLVAILGLTLTMCSRSSSNNSTSSSGTANADGTSTVSVSSLPTITLDNSSTLTISLANAGLSAISHTMLCLNVSYSSSTLTYGYCDASDDSISSGSMTHDAALAAGWKLVGSGCSSAYTSIISKARCVLFHK